MKKSSIILVSIIGIILLSLTGKKIYTMTRGIRNNNPGNIRHGSSSWLGMSSEKTDPAFVTFVAPEYGIRALALLLKNYMVKNKLTTIESIINRWAPTNENNTPAYIASVAKKTGFSPTQSLTPNSETLAKLTKAIIHHENGVMPYDENLIKKSIGLI